MSSNPSEHDNLVTNISIKKRIEKQGCIRVEHTTSSSRLGSQATTAYITSFSCTGKRYLILSARMLPPLVLEIPY
jgi:hypothetical protein